MGEKSVKVKGRENNVLSKRLHNLSHNWLKPEFRELESGAFPKTDCSDMASVDWCIGKCLYFKS